jgi:hypothetical protein
VSALEVAIAAGHLIGKLLEGLVRIAFWVLVAAVAVAVVLVMVIFGATKQGQDFEYRTRPK